MQKSQNLGVLDLLHRHALPRARGEQGHDAVRALAEAALVPECQDLRPVLPVCTS